MAGRHRIIDEFDDDGVRGLRWDPPPEFWVAHEQPGRPLGPGLRLFNCQRCRTALETSARRDPRHTLLVRTSFDRILVTAEYAAELWKRDGWVDSLLYQPGDWVRDIGSAPYGLPAPARWWSRCLAEQVGVLGALREAVPEHGRAPRLHHVA